jgi:mRNA interferase MazF
MTTYNQFDVVVVPFPFMETAGSKLRPALILSDTQTFNMPMQKAVLAMITTSNRFPWSLDISIDDLQGAGLRSPSIIRMKLFTLENRFPFREASPTIVRRIGTLSKPDCAKVEMALSQLFGM